jgi:hypothetical protein
LKKLYIPTLVLSGLLIFALSASTAFADTVLNFNPCSSGTPSAPCITATGWSTVTTEKNAPPAFGDNVTSNLDPNGYGYYGGTANTPDVTVEFDSRSLDGWYYWGGAESGLSFAADTGSGYVTLTAAPGYLVTLNGFDYNVFGAEGYALQVLDGGPTSTTVLNDYSGSTTGNAAEVFAPNETESEITIYFDNWNTGLQNIDFSESPVGGGGGPTATPEPSSLAIVCAGFAALIGLQRKRRTQRNAGSLM